MERRRATGTRSAWRASGESCVACSPLASHSHAMLLTRIYEDRLAQAAYLIADEHAGVGMIVDANLDVERYLDAATRERIRIVAVTETHFHADFLSGSRELARLTGAPLYLSAEGGTEWQYGFAASAAA